MNFYSYVGNNPVNHADPTGQWSSLGCHQHISYEAAKRNGWSDEDAKKFGEEVAKVDKRPGTQGADAYNANTHSMAGQKCNGDQEPCGEAFNGAKDQVSDAFSSGDIAKGAHTVQDSYSPAHRGFQPWDGGTLACDEFGHCVPSGIPSPWHIWHDRCGVGSDAIAYRDAINATTHLLKDYNTKQRSDPASYFPSNPCN